MNIPFAEAFISGTATLIKESVLARGGGNVNESSDLLNKAALCTAMSGLPFDQVNQVDQAPELRFSYLLEEIHVKHVMVVLHAAEMAADEGDVDRVNLLIDNARQDASENYWTTITKIIDKESVAIIIRANRNAYEIVMMDAKKSAAQGDPRIDQLLQNAHIYAKYGRLNFDTDLATSLRNQAYTIYTARTLGEVETEIRLATQEEGTLKRIEQTQAAHCKLENIKKFISDNATIRGFTIPLNPQQIQQIEGRIDIMLGNDPNKPQCPK